MLPHDRAWIWDSLYLHGKPTYSRMGVDRIHKWLLQAPSFTTQFIDSHSSDSNHGFSFPREKTAFPLGLPPSGYDLPAPSLGLFINTLVTPSHLLGTSTLIVSFCQHIPHQFQRQCRQPELTNFLRGSLISSVPGPGSSHLEFTSALLFSCCGFLNTSQQFLA